MDADDDGRSESMEVGSLGNLMLMARGGDAVPVKWNSGETRAMAELKKYRNDVQYHVSEVYSPPRVTQLALSAQMIPGMALDLTTVDPDDGKPWDLAILNVTEWSMICGDAYQHRRHCPLATGSCPGIRRWLIFTGM